MEQKRVEKSKKSNSASFSRDGRERKGADKREKSSKNTLREKVQSAKGEDKRKTRRDFFAKDVRDKRDKIDEIGKKGKSDKDYKKDKTDKGNKDTRNKRDRIDRIDTREKRDKKIIFSENSPKYRRDDRREFEKKEFKPRRERRSKLLDSEIIREIVQKRRAAGRSSKTPKILSLAWGEERGVIRLNKYIANSGICSRREADDLITAGVILVNGKVETELGTKVMPTDEIRYEDKILQREKPVYILLNKPKNFITTTDDEKSRDNVMMLIEGACPQRVYPVGRLDRNTTGLLLFTNDGEMTKKLTHPRYGVKKIYQVDLDKNMSQADFETLANGIELGDGLMKPDELAFVNESKNVLGITLHSGQNRIVRRLFEHLGYEVEKLDRVYYAGLTKKDLPRGEWRFLRQEEINILKMSL